MTGKDKEPLLPRPVLVFIAVIVTLGWLATVIAAVLSPNAYPLVIVSGLFLTVIGAVFGIGVRTDRSRNGTNSRNDSGDDKQ